MECFYNDLKYASIDEFGMNWIFYVEDVRVPDEDIKNIRALSEGYSALLWGQWVSSHKRHFALLNNEERQALLLEKLDYNWSNDWENDINQNFRNYINKKLHFNESDTVIVFWSKECAVETNWNIFLKHWVNFLFDDEGVVLVNTQNENILVFTSFGILQKGQR